MRYSVKRGSRKKGLESEAMLILRDELRLKTVVKESVYLYWKADEVCCFDIFINGKQFFMTYQLYILDMIVKLA